MDGERIDQAIHRIEAALARINAAAENLRSGLPASDNPELAELTSKHEALRAEVSSTLSDLDRLIEQVEA